jgi:type IV pilus assembly protein PilQ
MIKANMMMKTIFTVAYALFFATVAFAAAPEEVGKPQPEAQNGIENVSYSSFPGGKVEVKITLKQALVTPPAGFTTNNPPRIALDFPGTANLLGKSVVDVAQGGLRSLNVVQAGTRTRLVMNLAKPVSYETRMEGKDLFVTLQGGAPTASNANVTARFAEAGAGSQKHSLKDIDFRRGSNGEGRIVVALSDAATGIDIRKQGKNLVVDFVDTTITANLERRLDVLDFGTPVQAVASYSQGKNARMIIEPKGLWEYSAYQADRQFIIDVKPIVEDPNKMVQGGKLGYAGEKLSLNFQNVEVRQVLQVIADFTNLNIITSDTVTGTLTLRLKDVPWDQALDIILKAKDLDKRKNGNVVWIAPRDELAIKEKSELEAKQQIHELEPLQTEYYALNYLRADQAKSMLLGESNTSGSDAANQATCQPGSAGVRATAVSSAAAGGAATAQRILSKRGSATYELKTNTLIVNDIPSVHEEVRRLMTVIDVPAKQVMIEARVVLATTAFGKELGARLGVQQASNLNSGNRLGVSQNLENSTLNALQRPRLQSGPITTEAIDPTTGIMTRTYTVNQALGGTPTSGGGTGNSNVNLGVADAAGAIAMTLLNLGSGNLVSLELSAMESDGKGTVISNPRVMTSNQRPAAIIQGVQLPYLSYSNSGTQTVFRDALLCLLVNPQVLNNDSILLDVEVTKDSIGEETKAGLAINVQRVKTQILINNGDTAVLGGIFQQETNDTVTKVPLFGDLPVVGNLFKKTQRSDKKNELMIFITPRIVKESLNIQ